VIKIEFEKDRRGCIKEYGEVSYHFAAGLFLDRGGLDCQACGDLHNAKILREWFF
jgi:hypothetical protein